MEKKDSSLQIKPLQRSATPEEYLLYRAALEWDLIDPIVIEKREDLKSASKWKDKIEPYNHQVSNLITFCRRLPVTLLADDVGLGKTISAGLVASELIARGRLEKILIVCPKILGKQWQEELDTKFGIPSVVVTGKDLATIKPPGEIGAVITTYQSARLYLDQLSKAGFDMLILDEAHKLRNLYGVESPPQVAQKFRKVLADRVFKYVLMLTATPIQNRLWDLYSLVDLLTVARGHENPFGNVGMFSRKFIADNRTQARQLNPEMKDEFRSIVYGYMSRVRRGDANLHFPERVVQLHTVDPTKHEKELIKVIAGPIQKLNRLAQISILQALISSPHAVAAQLKAMAKKETVPKELAEQVKAIVDRGFVTSKLEGLGALVDKLKAEQPKDWRMIVFTCRRETQTTIQAFLEERGVSCALINGDSAGKNQETISKLKSKPPKIHVIISTEAGSEGVNLQAANVLVNYDLPWNPMIVEQRIGRIQRLASEHAKVCIFNIVLKGTFEEYIVGRLMEKLQMASHAIGDVEALLEASGIDEEEEDGTNGFEEKIRKLVIASLAGKDVEAATRKAAKSISDAKIQLEKEEKNINSLLGGMGRDVGPEVPQLPSSVKSMDAHEFTLKALESVGAKLSHQKASDLHMSELDGKRELIRFENKSEAGSEGTLFTSTLYGPGSPAFERLVRRITSKGLHLIEDADQHLSKQAESIARDWVEKFGGKFKELNVKGISCCFSGTALVRARVTVAHDSYERLIEIVCSPNEHFSDETRFGFDSINNPLKEPTSIGVNMKKLLDEANSDPGVMEFCRFYRERLADEINAAGYDPRKIKKIESDFTPTLEFSLVGLEGAARRRLRTSLSYNVESDIEYTSDLLLIPSVSEIVSGPVMGKCAKTGKTVPEECLAKCEISNLKVLRHLLAKSEISGRLALAEHIVICELTGKHVLKDEVAKSAVTGHMVAYTLLKKSDMSGKQAEPEFFGKCQFTSTEVLKTELAISQISGKRYRTDEELHSAVSGKAGHRQEFIFCSETNKPLLPSEAAKCEVTGKIVIPTILDRCEVSGKKVLPSELEKSSVSGKKALKRFFITSNISGARMLEEEGIRSVTGNFCAPVEAKICAWSGRKCHPDDLKVCYLTGVSIYFEYLTTGEQAKLETLVRLLEGTNRKADRSEVWPSAIISTLRILGKGKCEIEAAELSPDGNNLAICMEVRTMLRLIVRHVGFIYSIKDNAVVGRIAKGQRLNKGWFEN